MNSIQELVVSTSPVKLNSDTSLNVSTRQTVGEAFPENNPVNLHHGLGDPFWGQPV